MSGTPSRPEQSIFEHQAFGRRMGAGKVPALLVIDFTVGFNDPDAFGGGNIGSAVEQTVELLQRARALGWPVAHTRIVYAEDGSDANVHCLKVPRLLTLTDSNPQSRFVPQLMPKPGEIVIRKRLPSAFFGTDLGGMLMHRRVDTLFVAGCTTSGCVRASTLDAMCLGFRPMVVADCVGDRSPSAHAGSLFDLDKKYADVISRDEAFSLMATFATPTPADPPQAGATNRKE